MEGEFCWIGPLTFITEEKKHKWQLKQEVVVRVTVGFLNLWSCFLFCMCNCFQACNQELNSLLLYNQFAFLSLLSYLNLPGVAWPGSSSSKLRYVVSPEDSNILENKIPQRACRISHQEDWLLCRLVLSRYKTQGKEKKKKYFLTCYSVTCKQGMRWFAARGIIRSWHKQNLESAICNLNKKMWLQFSNPNRISKNICILPNLCLLRLYWQCFMCWFKELHDY